MRPSRSLQRPVSRADSWTWPCSVTSGCRASTKRRIAIEPDVHVERRVVERAPVERGAVERAPVRGRVEQEHRPGQVVRPGQPLEVAGDRAPPHVLLVRGHERWPSSGDTQPGSTKRETS